MSNLIRNNAIVENEWTTVTLPAGEETVRKQAGKVVMFKLTGEQTCTPEQIAATVIPENGRIIVPLAVWQTRKQELAARVAKGEVGIWLATHEPLQTLVDAVDDLNQLPIIAVHVERFADGRHFFRSAICCEPVTATRTNCAPSAMCCATSCFS